MEYRFSDLNKVDEKFQRLFGVGFKPFYDNLSPLSGHICINIIEFDDWLHKQIGDYEDDGLNMDEAIIEHYSQEASGLIEDLL